MDEPTRDEIEDSCFEELGYFIAAVAKGFPTDGDRLMSLAYAEVSVVGIRNALKIERKVSAVRLEDNKNLLRVMLREIGDINLLNRLLSEVVAAREARDE